MAAPANGSSGQRGRRLAAAEAFFGGRSRDPHPVRYADVSRSAAQRTTMAAGAGAGRGLRRAQGCVERAETAGAACRQHARRRSGHHPHRWLARGRIRDGRMHGRMMKK